MRVNRPHRRSLPLRDDELTERAMVTKIIFSGSGHSPKTVLLWKQASTRQRRLRGGPAWLASVRSTRATAANHRQLISACRRDELGVANSNVTSEVTDHTCPQHSWRPARAPAESRVRLVRPLD